MKAIFTLLVTLACVIATAQTHTVYDLDIKIETNERKLTVNGTAELVPAKKDKTEITLVVADQMTPNAVRLVSPTDMAGDATPTKTGGLNGSTAWNIKLPRTLKQGERLKIGFDVTGGEKTTFVFNIGPEGSFAGGPNTLWYPIFGDLSGTLPNVRLDADRAGTGMLRYDVPDYETVVSVGGKQAVKKTGGRAHFTYKVTQPAALSFACAKYKVYESKGTPPVAVYALTDIPEPQRYVDGCRRVMDELSKIFGPYPYPEFALVEVDDKKSSEASFGGAAMGGHMLSNTSFLKEGFNLAFFGHEIGHQWWGNLVRLGSDDGGYLLDEAMAQYGSLLCVERIGSTAEAARYRRNGYPGYIQRQSREGFLHMHIAGMDYPLRKMPSSGTSHSLADNKGVMIYNMLRSEIGEEKFHSALREITREYAFKQIAFSKFLEIVEKHAGREMKWFWDQWLDRKGAPLIDMTYKAEPGSVKITIEQGTPAYQLHLPVLLSKRDGSSELRTIFVTKARETFGLPIAGVTAVELDPYAEMLIFDPRLKAEAEAIKPLTEAGALFGAGKYAESRAKAQEIVKTIPSPDDFGIEFYSNYLIAGTYRMEKNYPEAKAYYQKALQCATKRPYYIPYAYLHLGRVAKELGDDDLVKWCARQAISAEKELKQYTSISREAEKALRG